jgi:hypothetical protein
LVNRLQAIIFSLFIKISMGLLNLGQSRIA